MRDTKEMLEEKKCHKWFTGLHISALSQIQILQSDSWLSGGAFFPLKLHLLLTPLCGEDGPTLQSLVCRMGCRWNSTSHCCDGAEQ